VYCGNSKRITVVPVVVLMIPVNEDYTAMNTWIKMNGQKRAEL